MRAGYLLVCRKIAGDDDGGDQRKIVVMAVSSYSVASMDEMVERFGPEHRLVRLKGRVDENGNDHPGMVRPLLAYLSMDARPRVDERRQAVGWRGGGRSMNWDQREDSVSALGEVEADFDTHG